MTALHQWIRAHEALLWTLGSLSVLVFAGSLLLVPWLVLQLPDDYFLGPTRAEHRPRTRHPVARVLLLAAKNLLGAVLLLAGAAMLLLPGQGLLTLFVGLGLLDFPGKYRLEQRLVRIPVVFRSLNWIRRRGGRPPIRTAHVGPPA